MTGTWLSYYSHVKNRLTINRGFFKGAVVVAKLYGHFKYGTGKRKLPEGEDRLTIAFYPQPAGPWYNIWLVLQNTNLKIIKDIHAADYIFVFDDSTHTSVVAGLADTITAPLINANITDISKSNVGRIFEDVFGYGLEVDPLSYEGKVVEKSDENGTHDGRIVECPIQESDVKPGCSYQKFVDSSFSGETSEDLRVAAVFGEVAAVFHKHKAFEKRFGTEYLSTTVRSAEDVFSQDEQANISRFCTAMGLDFGAIDVMRDKHDERIYIVDVNKTCMPVLSLPPSEQYKSLKMIADVFERGLPSPKH